MVEAHGRSWVYNRPLSRNYKIYAQSGCHMPMAHSSNKSPRPLSSLSAHWESNPIQISSSAQPPMYFDYGGFPPETKRYTYPAPGSPSLAAKIQTLLRASGIDSELNGQRGFDHGVFVPLKIMFPDADIPIVMVSLHSSLNVAVNMQVGAALSSLRDDGNVLFVGSGYTFHNRHAFFHPSEETYQASLDFNTWLKDAILGANDSSAENHAADATNSGAMTARADQRYAILQQQLQVWESAPGARLAHPRSEHLIPLFTVVAAAGTQAEPHLAFETLPQTGQFEAAGTLNEHVISSYVFV